MNRFSNRQRDILEYLSTFDSPQSGKVLSEHLNVSVRTIQNEISNINKIIKIISSSNKGYSVIKDVYNDLDVSTVDFPSVDDFEIIRYIFFLNQPENIDEIAEKYYMSTSSLEKKLRNFNETLSNYDLKIERTHGDLYIYGNELNKRKFIRDLISTEVNSSFKHIDLSEYFQGMDIEYVKNMILNIIDRHDYYVDSIYKDSLILNIIIVLYRMRFENYLTPIQSFKIDESIYYTISQEICTQYSNHWSIHPTDDDIQYIANLLVGQIKSLNLAKDNSPQDEIISQDFINTIDTVLKDTFNHYLLDIDFKDLLYNFALHTDGMIKRVRSNNPAGNALLASLKKQSPFILDVSIYIAHKFNNLFKIQIPESEISLIAIHIGYLIENSLKGSNKLNVLLYCDNYHHIADKIKAGLDSNLSSFISITIINQIDENDIRIQSSDLLITTKTVKVYGLKTITISPFFNLNDQMNVVSSVQSCLMKKRKEHYNDLIKRFFKKELYFSKDIRTKEEAITFLGNQLIDAGIVKQGFVESVFQREKMSSTCFYGTFAIPHGIQLDAKQTMCCVLINENKIQWDSEKISIVLMIAVQKEDRQKFMELYELIISYLEKPDKYNRIVHANSFKDFITILID